MCASVCNWIKLSHSVISTASEPVAGGCPASPCPEETSPPWWAAPGVRVCGRVLGPVNALAVPSAAAAGSSSDCWRWWPAVKSVAMAPHPTRPLSASGFVHVYLSSQKKIQQKKEVMQWGQKGHLIKCKKKNDINCPCVITEIFACWKIITTSRCQFMFTHCLWNFHLSLKKINQ